MHNNSTSIRWNTLRFLLVARLYGNARSYFRLTVYRNFDILWIREGMTMPTVEVVFYQEKENDVPVLDWIERTARRDRRIVAKCLEKIERLAEMGHQLRRPDADFLRDGIYELRIRWSNVNYPILYFFHGRT